MSSDSSSTGVLCAGEQHRDPSAYAYLDTSILTLIEHLFSQKEFELFAKMLQHTTVKQYGLPGQGSAIAQIIVPSLTVFAQQIGHGKDTVLRHLAVYRALGLLMQRRVNHQTLLSFPLAPYELHPETTLPALDLLMHTGRPKLQQLARSVKERYQLCYCPTALIDAHPSASSQESELAMLFLEVQQLLEAKRIPATRRQLLQVRIAAILRQLAPAGRPHSHEGDRIIIAVGTREENRTEQGNRQGRSSKDEGDLATPSTQREDYLHHQGDRQAPTTDKQGMGVHHQGDFLGQQGDQDGRISTTSEDLQQQQGDQHAPSISKEGDFQTHQGDRKHSSLSLQEDLQQQQGDCNSENQRNHPQRGDFPTYKGDFSAQNPSLSINDIESCNKNIFSTKENDTSIDRVAEQEVATPKKETATPDPGEATEMVQKEATALAWFLDKSLENVASFVKKLKVNRMAVRASVIDVLYHEHFPDYRGVPRIRGAWFNTAYKYYLRPETVIPAEINRWLQSTLSWTEMEEALTQEERKMRGDTQLSLCVSDATSPRGKDVPASLSSRHSHNVDAAGSSVESQEDNTSIFPEEMSVSDQQLVLAPRSDEERKVRRNAARRIREQLQQSGVVVIGRDGKDGLEIDTEHHCGCPLYRSKGLRRFCAHCAPDLSWDQEVRTLIASLLDS